MGDASAKLPAFSSLLKSRSVEDPINVFVHRPLAYAFVKAVYRTSITPNMVTGLAGMVGVSAGVCFVWGSPAAMVAGGLLLWTSAILDGADGILARAKNMQSQFGRALDGTMDMVVAIATVVPAVYHMWVKHHDPVLLVGAAPIVLLTLVHLQLYDFYKESFLRLTRPKEGGEAEDLEWVEETTRNLTSRDARWFERLSMRTATGFLRGQRLWLTLTNPVASHPSLRRASGEEGARVYRTYNAGPMRLWALISLAPHSYLMSICAMADRLDLYFWIRLLGMNAIFLVAAYWQRRASMQTLRHLSAAPEPVRKAAAV